MLSEKEKALNALHRSQSNIAYNRHPGSFPGQPEILISDENSAIMLNEMGRLQRISGDFLKSTDFFPPQYQLNNYPIISSRSSSNLYYEYPSNHVIPQNLQIDSFLETLNNSNDNCGSHHFKIIAQPSQEFLDMQYLNTNTANTSGTNDNHPVFKAPLKSFYFPQQMPQTSQLATYNFMKSSELEGISMSHIMPPSNSIDQEQHLYSAQFADMAKNNQVVHSSGATTPNLCSSNPESPVDSKIISPAEISSFSSFPSTPQPTMQSMSIDYKLPNLKMASRGRPCKKYKPDGNGEPSKKRRFICTWAGCGKEFPRLYNLKSHLLCHSGERPHACMYCASTFGRKHDLQRHVRTLHADAKLYECPICYRGFPSVAELKRHIFVDENGMVTQEMLRNIRIKPAMDSLTGKRMNKSFTFTQVNAPVELNIN